MADAQSFTCYCCGAVVAVDTQICSYCENPVRITTLKCLSNVSSQAINKYLVSYQTNVAGNSNNSSPIAFCLLKLKLYDKALSFFENAVIENPGDSEIHFYTAVCCLKGRKAFLTPRSDIDKAMAYIEAAKSIDPCSIYDYFLSYIKLDFFHRKGYNVDPSYQIELDIARRKGLAEGDVQHLYEVLSTPRPAAI